MLIVVVAEAASDARIAQDLADRVVYANTDTWCDLDHLEATRTWTCLEALTDTSVSSTPNTVVFTRWRAVKHLAQEKGIRNLGFLSTGEPGNIDSAQSRKAILLFERLKREEEDAKALLLIRDMDQQPKRREGMNQAREMHDAKPFDIIIGAANPKREAWVLNGFEPEGPMKKQHLTPNERTSAETRGKSLTP